MYIQFSSMHKTWYPITIVRRNLYSKVKPSSFLIRKEIKGGIKNPGRQLLWWLASLTAVLSPFERYLQIFWTQIEHTVHHRGKVNYKTASCRKHVNLTRFFFKNYAKSCKSHAEWFARIMKKNPPAKLQKPGSFENL